ncbi:hypothetical protein QBC36DRAFT_342383 [Triangularia setosa]|uniref:Uncharacterized protein n=1 Tax=Triangularia setosa TaxID=2587417 RepID=A0AAN6WFM3_9PEZI|nr:hypothetical protein QBC36DRAFT_342383 [Podospora setosa]
MEPSHHEEKIGLRNNTFLRVFNQPRPQSKNFNITTIFNLRYLTDDRVPREMATVDSSPILKFLTDAGHLLAFTAPEISAYIFRQRNDLMFEHEIPLPEVQRQHVCTACGNILAFGKGSDLVFKKNKKTVIKKKQQTPPAPKVEKGKRQEPRSSGPTKHIVCGYCSSQIEVKLSAPTPIVRRAVKPAQKIFKTVVPGVTPSLPKTSASHEATTSSQKPTSNANSKKRAKSRKAGLQALLEQSKNSRPSPGLSLADFMSK